MYSKKGGGEGFMQVSFVLGFFCCCRRRRLLSRPGLREEPSTYYTHTHIYDVGIMVCVLLFPRRHCCHPWQELPGHTVKWEKREKKKSPKSSDFFLQPFQLRGEKRSFFSSATTYIAIIYNHFWSRVLTQLIQVSQIYINPLCETAMRKKEIYYVLQNKNKIMIAISHNILYHFLYYLMIVVNVWKVNILMMTSAKNHPSRNTFNETSNVPLSTNLPL